MADLILLDPPPAAWKALPSPPGDPDFPATLFAAGAARVKALVHVDESVEPSEDGFPDELRETLEARGAPNGVQMEFPLDQADETETLDLPGVQGALWRLHGGSYVRKPPAKGWNHGGEHVIAAGLVVKGECRLLVLGGPPDAVAAAASDFERWVRSARAGPRPKKRRPSRP